MEFKIGQRVLVKKEGKEFTVAAAGAGGYFLNKNTFDNFSWRCDDPLMYTVDTGVLLRGNYYYHYPEHDLSDATVHSFKFKRGDLVVKTKNGWELTNTVGDKPTIKASIPSTESSVLLSVRDFIRSDDVNWYRLMEYHTGRDYGNWVSELGLRYSEKNESSVDPFMGFKVGDRVKVVKSGSGVGAKDVGSYVTITELCKDAYCNEPAARIAENIGNQASGGHGRWIGLCSFEKVETAPIGASEYKSLTMKYPHHYSAKQREDIDYFKGLYTTSSIFERPFQWRPVERRGIYPSKPVTKPTEDTYHQVPVLIKRSKNKSKLLTI